MHIGYFRYSQNLFLDYVNASVKSGGATVRLGIIEAFLKLGHKVTLLSKVSPKHKHVLEGKGEFFDYRMFKRIKYEPTRVPKDLDILFIESAVARIHWVDIERIRQIFNNFSGQVVYYHHADQLSCLPLGAMMDGEGTGFVLQEGNKSPSYNDAFKGMNFEDKQYVLLTHADPKLLIEKQDTERFRYTRFDHSIRMPLCYSENFDRMERIAPIDNRPYDLIYIGHEKTPIRTRRMNTLYGTRTCCKRLLYGNWNNPPRRWDYKGEFPGHGRVYQKRVYQQAKASVLTADSWFFDVQMVQTRPKEAIRSWNLVLVDNSYNDPDSIFGSDFVISDHSDVHRWIDASPATIVEAIAHQHSYLNQWTFELEKVLTELNRIRPSGTISGATPSVTKAPRKVKKTEEKGLIDPSEFGMDENQMRMMMKMFQQMKG